MERTRDLRRTPVAAVNGSPRRRQRISTLRDSTDHDSQMELQETVRLGDEREFQKRRRIDKPVAQQRSDGGESYRENSTDSSDEEYYEEEQEMRVHRTNQLSPASSSPSINRQVLRTFRSSPALRAATDEMFGVPVPRRARSSSGKRLHEYCNSGTGGFGEDLSHRRLSPSPVSLIGSGDSMKKKMRSSERRTTPFSDPPKLSVIQDDIEIEVAEALFDLMKQSKSQSRFSQRQEKVDSVSVIPPSDELKMSKADGGKDENNAFSVQTEPSIKVNGETVLDDSVKERRKEGTVVKDKIWDQPAQDLVSGDGFVNKVRVGSSKESESPSCVKVNACDIQDLTVTKAHYDAIIVEAKNETKLEIDLMASPLPSSPEPEREELVDKRTDNGVMTQTLRKKSEMISKDAVNSNQQLNLDVEKHIHETTQQQQGRKEHKNQSPTSLLPFPFVMNSWPSVFPHQGYMLPIHPAIPINGSPKSSMIMQPPQFKFSQPRQKRCATQQYLAQSIHCHQQLIKKSLSSGSTDPAPLSRSKSTSLIYSPPQSFTPDNHLQGDFSAASVRSEKDKSSDAGVAFNATTSSKPLLQQASYQASASSYLNGSGYILPFGLHQAKMMAPASSSGSPLSASKLPVTLPLPNASTAMSFNLPMFPSNEAAPYMAMLQNNGSSIPMTPFKRGPPSLAFFNPSLYPPQTFSVTQNQQQLTTSHSSLHLDSQNSNLSQHKQPQTPQQTGSKTITIENKFPISATSNSQSERPVQPSDLSAEIKWKNGSSLAPGFVSHSVKPSNLQTSSSPAQPMSFATVPPVSIASGGSGNEQIDPYQHGSKGRTEQIPQGFAFSFGSNGSAAPVLNFSSIPQTSGMFQMLPDMSWNGNHMIHHSNFQASEGKSLNYSKSDCSEISALSTVGPPKFDSLARSMNYLPPSFTGSQPFQTSLIQDHHMHQMHLAGRGQVKPIYASTNDAPSFHPKWEGSSQLKTSQGQSHINFVNAAYRGHQFDIKSEPVSSLMVGLPSNASLSRNIGNSLRNASTASALPSQEAEASQGGASQKSSPACRRNVPSILSMSPSKLPELKY